jgi:hypothetical protein
MVNNVIPLDPKKRLEISLRPAELTEAQEAVAVLAKALPVMPSIEDPRAFKATMAEFLAAYPADVLVAAVNEAITRVVVSPEDGSVRVLGFDCMPSTRQIVEICERLIEPRRAQLRAIERAENERRAHEQEAAARAAEAEQEAQRAAEKEARRQAYMQGLEERARERFGNDAPLPGDIELADTFRTPLVRRAGIRIAWHAALEHGEEWAAKFCRLMALAARIRDAVLEGRARWNEGLALAKKLTVDEAEVRRLIDEIERRPSGPGETLTRSFWNALWGVHRACGCDVPADVVFSEDQAAALQSIDPAARAMLADATAVMNREFEQKFWAERAAKGWSVTAPQSQPPAAPEIKEEERR